MTSHRAFLAVVAVLAAAVALLALSVAPAAQPTPKGGVFVLRAPSGATGATVTLCHHLGNGGYITVTVDDNGSLDGHAGHELDIIPAPPGGCASVCGILVESLHFVPTTTAAPTRTTCVEPTTTVLPTTTSAGTTTTAAPTSTTSTSVPAPTTTASPTTTAAPTVTLVDAPEVLSAGAVATPVPATPRFAG